MICPACQHCFRLRLREYFSFENLRNRHQCPACGRLLKWRVTSSYFAVLCIWMALVVGVPTSLVMKALDYGLGYDFPFLIGFGVPVLILVLCAILFVLPIDYLMQSYWLKSKEVEHEKNA